MRSDRLLSILMLLQSRGRLSAAELARQLEVSQRTIYRDIEALSAAGVPVYAERGRNGGCALLPGYRTDMTGLSTDEARALFVFTGRGETSTPGMEPALRSALRKLMAALPAGQQPDVDHAMQRVVVDSRRWGAELDDNPALPAIEDAVWQDLRIEVRYKHGRGGKVATYTLDPYGLVHKSGIWYLIAADSDGPRMFRVSRVEQATVLTESSSRPADLDLEVLWEQLRTSFEASGEGLAVVLRVRASWLNLMLGVTRRQMVEPPDHDLPDADGWCEVRARFRGMLPARGVLLGLGTEVQVLSPPELRDEMLATARAVIAAYETDEQQ